MAADEEKMRSIIENVEENTSILLTVEQATALFSSATLLMEEVDEWGVDDTVVRGLLTNHISEELLGEPWPTYGSDVSFNDFVARLQVKARERGYAITE